MSSEDKLQLWRSLNLLEDWLGGGIRHERPEPAFGDQSGPAGHGTQAADEPTDSPLPYPPEAPGRSGVPEADSLEAIAAEVRDCSKCRLGDTRRKAVPGQGVDRPLVMVIGEGPGAEEDVQGLPFVGPAGKLLDRMLASVDLYRDRNCFIANVVKCRPPGNRDPAPDERDACSSYLRRQIALLRPQVLLCVGRVAIQALLGTTQGISALRGRWLSYEGLPLIATYHPSALLRDESLKRPAWEDLKKLRDFLAREGDEGASAAGFGPPPEGAGTAGGGENAALRRGADV
ncbi:MAG TPA: uracil-DNA glycosylase [Rectinemataceae bacterium]|nr:uracil-DNA glycosylase [Rectinemataceae bacterium]